MTDFKPTKKSKVIRSGNRGKYDKKSVYKALDAAFMCHISYLYDDTSIIIPTAYARSGDKILVHGAKKNRMLNSILGQKQACIAVTHLDGLVLARSAFHHSMNYRSVVLFGLPVEVEEEAAKEQALYLISENILKGRWNEVRKPTSDELKATLVVSIEIREAALKERQGAPIDNEEDYALPIWAGELPIETSYQKAIPDPALSHQLEMPVSVLSAVL